MAEKGSQIKDAQISAKVTKDMRREMEVLVEKGMFKSLSECTRTAINRLLRDIDAYIKKAGEERSEWIKEEMEKRNEEEMEELRRFVEEIGDLYR